MVESRQSSWYQANRGRILAAHKERLQSDPVWAEQKRAALRLYHRKMRGIVGADGSAGPDRCEVCGSCGPVELDHDHTTGWIRGWLCRRCHAALGMACDSSDVLRRLADYLDAHQLGHQ